MVQVSQEILNHLNSFNATSFKLDMQKKPFIYEVINLGEMLIGAIYDRFDIKFASAIINSGVPFSPNKLLFGLYSRNYTVLKAHIADIRDSISIRDYRISHDILDAMYSNNYVKYYNSFECFYPPAILANITKTNRPEYSDKIYQLYKDLYDNGSIVIRDVLDISAIAAIRSPHISFIIPITDSEASKYAFYLNTSNQNELKLACLFPLSDFNDLEIGGVFHELTHLAVDYGFQNSANPYKSLNDSQKKDYNYAAKQMISNITSMIQIDFPLADIENHSIATLKFKNDLLEKKDIILYSTIHRLNEPVILDLVSRIFFKFAKGGESTAKYIKALYAAEVTAKNTSKVIEIALERFGDWAIYPDEDLDKESIARFVEVLYRYEKLSYSKTSLDSMMIYWQDNVGPMKSELKKSLHSIDCADKTRSEIHLYNYDYDMTLGKNSDDTPDL